MNGVRVEKDPEALSVTLIADFEVPAERVWALWADPRKLEQWWGPPGYPATFEVHDLVPGSEASYFMTGPRGERHSGLWRITAVDAPTTLEFTDAFANAEGEPVADMPLVRVSVRLIEQDDRTRMEMCSRFDSPEDMEKWMDTGTHEGQQAAIEQMIALLS